MQIPMVFKPKWDNTPRPLFATDGSSGFDLHADLGDSVVMASYNPKVVIPTGVFIAVPKGYEMQVRSRSGMAAKYSVFVLNSPGTIDSDYRGEVMVILMNLSPDKYTIRPGDRIAQGVICPIIRPEFVFLKDFPEEDKITERGTGKFGSTGL